MYSNDEISNAFFSVQFEFSWKKESEQVEDMKTWLRKSFTKAIIENLKGFRETMIQGKLISCSLELDLDDCGSPRKRRVHPANRDERSPNHTTSI